MRWFSIEVILKDRKRIYLPLQGNKVIQTHTLSNLLNKLSPFAIITLQLNVDNPELFLVKTSKSDGIKCPMLNALEFNLDPTTKSYFSQAC